jgi:hypothetical protein
MVAYNTFSKHPSPTGFARRQRLKATELIVRARAAQNHEHVKGDRLGLPSDRRWLPHLYVLSQQIVHDVLTVNSAGSASSGLLQKMGMSMAVR